MRKDADGDRRRHRQLSARGISDHADCWMWPEFCPHGEDGQPPLPVFSSAATRPSFPVKRSILSPSCWTFRALRPCSFPGVQPRIKQSRLLANLCGTSPVCGRSLATAFPRSLLRPVQESGAGAAPLDPRWPLFASGADDHFVLDRRLFRSFFRSSPL